jgi:hypothetical protein
VGAKDRSPGTASRHTVLAASDRSTSWATWREAVDVVRAPHHLRSCVIAALVVGSVLFAINQLDVVVEGRASDVTLVKVVLTFIVPFLVSNYGILMATRRRGGPPQPPDGDAH